MSDQPRIDSAERTGKPASSERNLDDVRRETFAPREVSSEPRETSSGPTAERLIPQAQVGNDSIVFSKAGNDRISDLLPHSPEIGKGGLNGVFMSPDGKERLAVAEGRMLTATGKYLGRLSDQGEVTLPDGSSAAVNGFRDRWVFLGEQAGNRREFVTGGNTVSGTIFMKEADGGVQTKYDVRMGMLINNKTGEQVGSLLPPSLHADGSLSGGAVVLFDAAGKHEIRSLSSLQNATFELKQMGITGGDEDTQQRILRGITSGDNAGKSEIFSISQALHIEAQRKQLAERNRADAKVEHDQSLLWARSENDITRAGKSFDAKLNMESDRQRFSDQNVGMMMQMLATGDVNQSNLMQLRRRVDVSKEELGIPLVKASSSQKAADNIALPELTEEKLKSTNGRLRIGQDSYEIRNGQLFSDREAKESLGSLRPGYEVKWNNGSVMSLADQNRVLLEMQNGTERHRIIGTGPAHFSAGRFEAGGLVDAESLLRQAKELREAAAAGNKEYFDKRPNLTGGFSSWAMGGRDEVLRDFSHKLDREVNYLGKGVDNLFKDGFDNTKTSNADFDRLAKRTEVTLSMIGRQSSGALSLAEEGTNLQRQLNDGIYIAATTVATAGIGTGFALAANSTKIAQMGRVGQLMMFGAETTATGLTTGTLSATIRDTAAEDGRSNFSAGFVQGLGGAAASSMHRMFTGGATLAQTAKIAEQAEKGLPLSADQLRILGSFTGQLVSKGSTKTALVTGAGIDAAGDLAHTLGYAQAERLREGKLAAPDAEEIGTMFLASRLGGAVSSRLQSATKSELINNVLGGTANSFTRGAMQSIPEAIDQSDRMTSERLGKPVDQIGQKALLQNRDWSAIAAHAIESGLSSAALSPLLSMTSYGVGRGLRSLSQRQKSDGVELPRAGKENSATDRTNEKPTLSRTTRYYADSQNITEPSKLPPMKADRRPSAEATLRSQQFSDSDEISVAIPDGFQQAGARANFHADGSFDRGQKEPYASTVVDRHSDPVLRDVISEAKSRFGRLPEADRAVCVAKYAHDLLDGRGIDGSDRTRSNNTERWQAQFRQDNSDQRILLGHYIREGKGTCSEQALLTKVLADELGLQATLVRGDKNGGNELNHSWTKMQIGADSKIYDPRNERYGVNPPRGYREGSQMERPNSEVYEASGASGIGRPLRTTAVAAARWEGTKYRRPDGTVRNDDNDFVSADGKVVVALDGAGGLAGGQVASTIARERLQRDYSNFPHNGTEQETRAWLRTSLERAHEDIRAVAAKAQDAKARGEKYIYGTAPDGSPLEAGTDMITTAAATVTHGDKMLVAWAGDSRAYRLRAGRLEQLTVDDTNPGSPGHLIANSLGGRGGKINEATVDLRAGDRILVATDGLETLKRDEVERIMSKGQTPERTAQLLTEAVKAKVSSNAHPMQDNLTALVFDVTASAPRSSSRPTWVDVDSSRFAGGTEIAFGRNNGLDTTQREVSRSQFVLRRTAEGSYEIKDAPGRSNPTLVNGKPIGNTWIPVGDQDKVSVSGFSFELKFAEPIRSSSPSGNSLKLSEMLRQWKNGNAEAGGALHEAIARRSEPVLQENLVEKTAAGLEDAIPLRQQFLLDTSVNSNLSVQARRTALMRLAVAPPTDGPSLARLRDLAFSSTESDPVLKSLAANSSAPSMDPRERAMLIEIAGISLNQGADIRARFREIADEIRKGAPRSRR